MRTTNKRIGRGLIILGLALACAPWGWDSWAAQTSRFDKLQEEDRQEFSKRFEKEIWPLMTRGEAKKSCVGCHAPVHISSMRIKDKEADKVFRMLLKQGFFLVDDIGGILHMVSSKNPKERMPKNLPPWTAAEVEMLRNFVVDLDKKQQK